MMQIRYPNITGKTPEEKVAQMERAFRSTVDQLNLFLQKSNAAVNTDGSQNGMMISNPSSMRMKALEETVSSIQKSMETSWEKIYPVGAIYMSLSPTSPETLFGGKWKQLLDRFLLAAGNSYAVGAEGGSATHTLTVDEMPSHSFTISAAIANAGGYGLPQAAAYADRVLVSGGGTIGTNSKGGSKAHNNMPPYYAVYMWERTA